MDATYRIARQTSRYARFAQVSVEVAGADEGSVTVAADALRHEHPRAEWRLEAECGAQWALSQLPRPLAVTITEILATEVDTGPCDLYEAAVRAVWAAVEVDRKDVVDFAELRLLSTRFRSLIGQRLTGVVESRYWYHGERDGDAESLTLLWMTLGGPPIQVSVSGETLLVTVNDPGTDVDMDEYGEIRVAPAAAPDLLAGFVGRRLTGVTVFQGYTPKPSCGGLALDFDGETLVLGASGDEWVLVQGEVPLRLHGYWTLVGRFGGS